MASTGPTGAAGTTIGSALVSTQLATLHMKQSFFGPSGFRITHLSDGHSLSHSGFGQFWASLQSFNWAGEVGLRMHLATGHL